MCSIPRVLKSECLAIIALALVACGGNETGTPKPISPTVTVSTTAAPPKEKPPFVVIAIVVDQLAAWIADERFPLLPDTGGFARLRREGTWMKDVRFDHAVTDTAPGHASLFTGAIPAEHGIFANEVIDPGTRKTMTVLTDIEASVVTEKGKSQGGVSLKRLRAETVADRIREEIPDAWIFSASYKDRGALFGGGQKPDVLLWHDRYKDEFVTGPSGDAVFPSVARSLKDELVKIHLSTWTPADPGWVKTHAPSPDKQRGEGDLENVGTTFPHSFKKAQGLGVRLSPKGDEMLLDLTRRAIEAAHAEGKKHLFASVSLSTNDYIGHVFGPSSWEAWDEIYRLDAALGKFMTDLDAKIGENNYAIVLSADHGVMRLPELAAVKNPLPRDKHWELEPDRISTRILPDALAENLEKALDKELGPGDYVLGVADPYVYLTDNTKKLDPEVRERAWRTIALELAGESGLLRSVFLQDGKLGGVLTDLPEMRKLLEHSLAADSGNIYLLPRRGSLIDTLYVKGMGTGHGSPYLYDRSVPVLARAKGRIKEGAVVEDATSFAVYARTLAALASVAPPKSAVPAASLANANEGAR